MLWLISKFFLIAAVTTSGILFGLSSINNKLHQFTSVNHLNKKVLANSPKTPRENVEQKIASLSAKDELSEIVFPTSPIISITIPDPQLGINFSPDPEVIMILTPTINPTAIPTLQPTATPTQTDIPTPTATPTNTPTPTPMPLPTQQSNTNGLNADVLFGMVNNYRNNNGLPSFQKDATTCSIAAARAQQVYGEIIGNSPMHSGLKAMNLPYWITENIINFSTEHDAFNWWVNDSIHRQAILGNYTYSCLACSGNSCSEVFTNYTPK